MIAAIAFTLVPEGLADIPGWEFALWMLIGVVIFLVGDAIVDRRVGTEGAGGSIGIVVGSVVDGCSRTHSCRSPSNGAVHSLGRRRRSGSCCRS
jgi:hypothetical protein